MHALTVRNLSDPRRKILLAIVDDMIGASRSNQLGFVRRPDRGNNRGAKMLRPLCEHQANTAGSGVHENLVPRRMIEALAATGREHRITFTSQSVMGLQAAIESGLGSCMLATDAHASSMQRSTCYSRLLHLTALAPKARHLHG